jgi:hypothetical protein
MKPVTKMSTDDKKLEELIVYISDQCKNHDLYGSIKLNKILFFSDFFAVQSRGKSITGTDYQKLPHGPAPRRMKPILKKLEAEESIFVWSKPVMADGAMRQQKRPIARRNPDLSGFSGDEIALVDAVITELRHMTANEVSKMSHDHFGWRLAQLNETIPHSTAFLGAGSERLTAKDIEAGQKLLATLQ